MRHSGFIALLLLVSVAFAGVSCRKEKDPEIIRPKKERAVTIINKTGVEIKGYQVNVAGSGPEIERGAPKGDSFSIKINKSWDNDGKLEVVLVDKYNRIYAKDFDVPLGGNTDTPVTDKDRKSEGVLKDRWKDLVAWFNENH